MIPAGEVHLWSALLDVSEERLEECRVILSADERRRADRMAFPAHARHFAAARATLRELLAACLGAAPRDLQFHAGVGGKPALRSDGGDLRFNLSHSHGLALYAIAKGFEVGVDVERVRPGLPFLRISERFLSSRASAEIAALPEDLQAEAFFVRWTRAEALLKAAGRGVWDRREETGDARRFEDLRPAPGYVGALVLPREARWADRGEWPAARPALPAGFPSPAGPLPLR